MMRRRWSLFMVLLVELGLASCRYDGAQSLPLPGGAGTSGKTYHVTAIFADVTDLVPQSAVRVNDVAVGTVEKIRLIGYQAKVTMRLERKVVLPANAVADIRQTSLLGEKYVSLGPPDGVAPNGRLQNGAVIPETRTSRNAEVEEVFSALAGLLNGGGVAQLQTINVELSSALNGREDKVRDVLNQLNDLLGTLDGRKDEVVRAITSLDQLATHLSAQRDTIGKAIDNIAPGLETLADQRSQLTTLLASLSRLGTVGTRVINASKDNTVADLQLLQPILAQLNTAQKSIVPALELLTDFPFPSSASNAVHGDVTGLYASVDMNLPDVLSAISGSQGNCPSGQLFIGNKCVGLPNLSSSGGGLPSLPSLPALPKIPGITGPSSTSSSAPSSPPSSGSSGGGVQPSLPGIPLGPSAVANTHRGDITLLLLGGLR
jgi:phospholipid/cholesterol/gamma-HCH transport system substrate-binding protein